MASFFERRGYSAQTLKHDLEKLEHLSQNDALSKSKSTDEKISRIPLALALWRQCGRGVRAPDLKTRDPEFKSRSDH